MIKIILISGGIFITLNLLVKFIRFLPHRYSLAFGRIIGRILRLFLWRKVDRCESRCVKSLGVGVTIARNIIRGSFMNLGMSAVEFIRLPVIKSRLPELMSFPQSSIDILNEALSRGRGVIFLNSHMANWELAAARVIQEGFGIHAVFTHQANSDIDSMIQDIRINHAGINMSIESEGGSLRGIFKVLRSNGIIEIMQDLDARSDGIPSKFLGLPASTHIGIVKLYRKFKSPVVPVHYTRSRTNPEHHDIEIPFILSDMNDKNGRPFGEDLEASLEMCTNIVEGWIKERPELWMWLMDRWESTLGKEV